MAFTLLWLHQDKAAQPRVKLTRLRLRVCGAIFGQFLSGKIGLRS